MAKQAKTTPRTSNRKSTEWGIGQPLAFPPTKTLANVDRLAREVAEETMRASFTPKPQKPKKKYLL